MLPFKSKILNDKYNEIYDDQIKSFGINELNEFEIKELAISSYYSEIIGCSCGNPDDTIEILFKILKFIDSKETTRSLLKNIELNPKNQFHIACIEIILKFIDKKGWLEHGGSIWGSWLTDFGKENYQALDEIKNEYYI